MNLTINTPLIDKKQNSYVTATTKTASAAGAIAGVGIALTAISRKRGLKVPSSFKDPKKVVDIFKKMEIKEADAIIIGPGSIYTDVIPNLLVKNVAKTIRESKALKIYLSNIMTEPGQTDDYSVSEHINSIVEHCGKGIVNFCISDLGEIVPEYIRKYNLMGSSTVEIDSDKIKGENVQLIKGELASIDGTHIRHDPDKTAQLIIELICTDLRFKDKHNDEQYMLLNSRLKQEKKKVVVCGGDGASSSKNIILIH